MQIWLLLGYHSNFRCYLLYSFCQSLQADASLCGSKFGSPEIGGFPSLKKITQDLPRLR